MRVHANEFTGQLLRKRIVYPFNQGMGRQGILHRVQDEAIDFAIEYFHSFDLPSTPEITLISMHGFEKTNETLERTKGTITFLMKIRTASQRILAMEFPFPYYNGDLLSPTVAIYANKKFIISQDLIDSIVERNETKRPKVVNPLKYDMRIDHVDNLERQEFAMPGDPSGWSELVSERYI